MRYGSRPSKWGPTNWCIAPILAEYCGSLLGKVESRFECPLHCGRSHLSLRNAEYCDCPCYKHPFPHCLRQLPSACNSVRSSHSRRPFGALRERTTGEANYHCRRIHLLLMRSVGTPDGPRGVLVDDWPGSTSNPWCTAHVLSRSFHGPSNRHQDTHSSFQCCRY